MTPEQITKWAREVGMMEKYQVFYSCTPELQAFASIVRQYTLEEAALLCDRFQEREMQPAECACAIRRMKS